MINCILLGITLICTAFTIWLTVTPHGYGAGYDKGLEDGIRLTNEVLQEGRNDYKITEEIDDRSR